MNKESAKTSQTRLVTLDDVVRMPPPGMAAPNTIRFSPDGKSITYLFSQEGSLSQDLFSSDLESGEHRLLVTPPDGGTTEENVSPEEELLRERMRQRSLGITQYTWDAKQERMMVPLKGDIYVLDKPGEPLRKLFECNGKPAQNPKFSPDGNWISFVQDAEIYVLSVEGGEPVQITHGARGTGKTHGLAEYIAQEEMGRLEGYWWSKNSQWIAFTEVDETHIPVYRIMHQGKDVVGEGAQEDHRYPFAGEPNAKVRLAVISREGGDPVWMDYSTEDYEYLTRVHWLPDGGLAAQLSNRAQDELVLVRFDIQTGSRQEILREQSEVWINLHNMFRPLKKEAKAFLWASERSGFQHLYLYDTEGNLQNQLTSGDWMVEEIAGVDEEKDQVYFMATRSDARERHLYAVSITGGKIRQITQQSGMHQVVIDKAKKHYVDIFNSLQQPLRVTLNSLEDGSIISTIYENDDPRLNELKLPPPEMISMQNRDGWQLFGAIYRPPASFGEGPFPTVVYVYGGPHGQMVTNSWRLTASMLDQYLASLGFLVFRLDNRGSGRRGLAFEGELKHCMGQPEVQDQVDGVRYLVERGLTDPERVGMTGWSYGGYMSAMCLMQAPDVFSVAVAGAPATDYDGYDTHYTERYMGTPQENPEGYRLGSVKEYVKNMQGHLLIIHGLIDENVHFRHTARLINALIDEDKPYDLVLLPDSRHGPRKPAYLRYYFKHLAAYFQKHLQA